MQSTTIDRMTTRVMHATVCVHVCMHARERVCMCVCVCVWVGGCICVCMGVCLSGANKSIK